MAEKDNTYAWGWWLMLVFGFLAVILTFVGLLNNHHTGAYISATVCFVLSVIFIFLNAYMPEKMGYKTEPFRL